MQARGEPRSPECLEGERHDCLVYSPVLCDFELDDPSINAVWPPNRALSAKVRAFVDFLSDRFGGTPYWDDALPKANGASPR